MSQEQSQQFWVHGAPAYGIDQVIEFLTGDAHDRSKVEWYDGKHFVAVSNFFPIDLRDER